MGSGIGILTDGTKPLPEPMLNYHSKVLRHLLTDNSTGNAQENDHYNAFEVWTFKIKGMSQLGQWVNVVIKEQSMEIISQFICYIRYNNHLNEVDSDLNAVSF